MRAESERVRARECLFVDGIGEGGLGADVGGQVEAVDGGDERTQGKAGNLCCELDGGVKELSLVNE